MFAGAISASLLSALLGGVAVAVANQLFARRKTHAEIGKLRAEQREIELRADKLADEMENTIAEVKYAAASANRERVIYDTRVDLDRYDFRVAERGDAKGTFAIEDGILSVRRSNIEGRFELRLERYLYDGEREHIPRNERIAGNRRLRVSCQAKSVGGAHTLDFVLRKDGASPRLATGTSVVDRNEWTPIEHYFRIPPGDDCRLYVYDIDLAEPDTSVQLRDLVLAERLAD
jgi:hypothetical protein